MRGEIWEWNKGGREEGVTESQEIGSAHKFLNEAQTKWRAQESSREGHRF